MAKVRVYELAKRLGTDSKTLLQILRSEGHPLRSGSSTVPPEGARRAATVLATRLFERHAPVEREQNPAEPVPNRAPATLDDLRMGLFGSPYSIPDGQNDYLTETLLPAVAQLETRCEQARANIAGQLAKSMNRINRTSEIYESNQLEGLGPDLARTEAILKSSRLVDAVDLVVAREALERSLHADAKTREVVGLGAAKVLAEQFCGDRNRPLTEVDIRGMHELILHGDPDAGRYKRYVNEIVGAAHKPTLPIDTPDAMRQLVQWLRESSAPLIWRAAVAHAWLTHIHPFHDGNGRLARLLVNIILVNGRYPPLIIRSTSDRGTYIDALGESDLGGDVLPLTKVFRRALNRSVNYLEDPNFAKRLFEADVRARQDDEFVRWTRHFEEFLSELGQRLVLRNLTLQIVGSVSAGDYKRLRVQRFQENIWVAKVKVRGKRQDLLLHLSSMTSSTSARLERDQLAPSIFVSVKNQRSLDAHQYVRIGGHVDSSHEFSVLLDEPRVVIRRDRTMVTLETQRAAETAAEMIARIARQLVIV